MSVLTRCLNRLRCTYSVLRLSYNRDYQRLDVSSQHNIDVLKKLSSNTKNKKEPLIIEQFRENEYAHNVFLNSLKYKNSITPEIKTHAYVTDEEALELLDSNWAAMNDEELLLAIKRLTYNICGNNDNIIKSSKYKNAFDELSLRLSKLNDDDLMMIIGLLVPLRQQFNNCETPEKERYKQLNQECVKRFTMLSFNDMLKLCDMLYEINHTIQSEYIWYAMRKLGNKIHQVDPHQLIQIFFFLNVCRKVPINMYELEYHFEKCLEELSINEISVASLGFFKTRTPIRSIKLLRKIMIQTINNMDSINNLGLAAIIKVVRYSMKLQEMSTFENLITAFIPYESRFTLITLSHVAHACARVTLYNKEFMDRLIERMSNEMKTARLKDLEKLVYIFTCFNIDSSNSIYSNVIEELRTTWDTDRAHEIASFPHIASRLIGYMSTINIYPIDLIKRIMTSNYLHKVCSGNYFQLTQEYCKLEYGLRIEVPEYDGEFLKPEICQFLTKLKKLHYIMLNLIILQKYFLDVKTAITSRTNVLLTEVLQICQDIFPHTSEIKVDKVLPQYSLPDVILCLDENNQLVPIKQFLSKFAVGEVKWVNKENVKNNRWIALIMASSGLLIQNNNLPTGYLAAKIRQLSIIGYKPIMVTHHKWCNHTQQERCDYIKELIFENNIS